MQIATSAHVDGPGAAPSTSTSTDGLEVVAIAGVTLGVDADQLRESIGLFGAQLRQGGPHNLVQHLRGKLVRRHRNSDALSCQEQLGQLVDDRVCFAYAGVPSDGVHAGCLEAGRDDLPAPLARFVEVHFFAAVVVDNRQTSSTVAQLVCARDQHHRVGVAR